MANPSPQDDYTLVEHLTELRNRLVYSLVAVIALSIVAWNFRDFFFAIVRKPIQPYLPEGGLIYTAVQESFLAHLKVSIMAGIIMACPIWVYQIWKFVAPGLYKNEKKFGAVFILFGSTLFLTGVCFVYFVVYPLAFEFLLNFGGKVDQAMISVSDYLSFFMTTTLMFGLAFELPLILTILGIMGIINKAMLKAMRRYALVLICIMSAVITPPDVMSMILLVIPLYGLYEASIVLVGIFGQKPEEL